MYDPSRPPPADGNMAITSMPGSSGPITSHPPGSPPMAPGLGQPDRSRPPGGVNPNQGVPRMTPPGPGPGGGMPPMGGGGMGGMAGMQGMDRDSMRAMMEQYRDAMFEYINTRPKRRDFEGTGQEFRDVRMDWRAGMPQREDYMNPAAPQGVAVGEPNPAVSYPPQAAPPTNLLQSLFGG